MRLLKFLSNVARDAVDDAADVGIGQCAVLEQGGCYAMKVGLVFF